MRGERVFSGNMHGSFPKYRLGGCRSSTSYTGFSALNLILPLSYSMNIYLHLSPNIYFEIFTLEVMVLGCGLLGSADVIRVVTLINRIHALIKDSQGSGLGVCLLVECLPNFHKVPGSIPSTA